MIPWFREHSFIGSVLVVYVLYFLTQQFLQARRRRAFDERFKGGGLDFELPPIVTLRVECRCGMSAMCGKKDAIVATGWAAPKKTGPDNRWMCPACAGGGSDG